MRNRKSSQSKPAASSRDASDRLGRAALAVAICRALLVPTGARADLPVPCSAGACGTGAPAAFVTSGTASAAFTGNALSITQASSSAVLNWRSFDIGAGNSVTFDQPSSSAVAINRIFQGAASKIFGSLSANGRVYLINQNGVLFGDGARVNVAGLVASSLDLTPEALEDGLTQAAARGRPAFEHEAGQPLGTVVVEQGATIETADGGQVFMFAPERVTNEGKIATPDGQTILAAGRAVYLATSSDDNLRGILVEVDGGGDVVNGRPGGASGVSPEEIVGQIMAERGNVTLAGLAVNQHGRVSATTSVRANGSIRLQARDTVLTSQSNGVPVLLAQRGGELTVGRDAVNEIELELDDPQTQVAVNPQLPSTVMMDGAQVRLLEGSRTAAPAGTVDIAARRLSQSSPVDGGFAPESDDSLLYLAPGAAIDVSGANVELPMESNVVRAELRASQLANSPEQRNGALRGQAVLVDVRRSGTREDGTTWQGTPLADVSADIAAVGRTIGERSLNGGAVSLLSQGSVLVAEGAAINVAGGSIRYLDGFVTTTQLLSEGRIYDIAAADPSRAYDGIGNTVIVEHPKWGITETFTGFGGGVAGRFEHGYVEGKDAGSVSVVAPWVALDGAIDGSTTRGIHQRLPSASIAGGQPYRPYDEVPLGAKLDVGFAAGVTRNSVLGDSRVGSGLVIPTLVNDDGAPFDPTRDGRPRPPVETVLRTDLVGPDRVARLGIFSNGRIRLPAETSLELPAGGQFTAAGAVIEADGSVDAPAGVISLTARSSTTTPTDVALNVSSAAALTARGQWVNDSPLVTPDAANYEPRYINGGRVNLAAEQGGVTLAAGSLVDVTGGAWWRSDGSLSPGTGGSVSIATTPDSSLGQVAEPVRLVLDGEIRGHSFAAGGRLAVTASSLCLADNDCSREPTELWVRPQLLEDSGFGSYQLSSNRGAVIVAPGTSIELQQRTLELVGAPALLPSSDSHLAFSRQTRLDDLLRPPVDLALSASINVGVDTFANDFARLPALVFGTGASIVADPNASVSVTANTRIDFDGTIFAPSGDISLSLVSTLGLAQGGTGQGAQFPDAQAIWLGSHARLSAPAVPRVFVDPAGRQTGEVLSGGSVSVTAQRGYIVASAGSVLDVVGASAELDVRSSAMGQFARRMVAGDAGSIDLRAAEGMLLSGELVGRAAVVPGARGGALTVALDPANRNDPGTITSVFPLGSRTIVLSQDTDPLALNAGAAIPRSLNGHALLSANDIASGGFDSVRLEAREIEKRVTGPLELAGLGTIRFDGAVALALPRSLELAAGVIDGTAASAHLTAPFVSIGANSRRFQTLPTTILPGAGTLTVDAGLLEIYGNVALQGMASSRLSASGDIRFRGIQPFDTQRLVGTLATAGNLLFSARQLYPTTLTDFDVRVEGSGGAIQVVGTGGASTPVLAAGGQLTLSAETIQQMGVVRAPFGQIALRGERVILGEGSLTSSSGAGSLIPFGETQGGFDWIYPLRDQQSLVFGRGDDALPEQRVVLEAADVTIEAGATVDIAGGGDLLAFEFEPGVNGTRDVLAASERPSQFAILPSLAPEYAPFDSALSHDSTLAAGDRVWLDGVAGLAAGFYTLLPARYSLLPGAYLVTESAGYVDIVPGERFSRPAGGTIVAGYRATTGTSLRDSRYSGYEVRPASDVRREARYVVTRATEFFPKLAEATEIAAPRLPNDAGVLSIQAANQLALGGTLRAQSGVDGRGAGVEISAERLRVVGALVAVTPGEVAVAADALTGLGAESLLLGATRSQVAGGERLDVTAAQITIDAGAELRVPELTLAATDRIDLLPGAVLSADGLSSDRDASLLVSGDGALLRVSSGGQARVERTGAAGARGTVEVADASIVRAIGGSVLVDVSRDSSIRGRLDVPEASLSLAASRISLGAASAGTGGLTLDPQQLAALGLDELVLTSRSSLDLYGAIDLTVRDLTINAGGIVNDSNARLAAADSLTLANPGGAATPTSGTGRLTLVAERVHFGAGEFAVGATDVVVEAAQQARATSAGATRFAGDVEIRAGAMTTDGGVDHTIAATGLVRTSSLGNSGPFGDAGLGGLLTLRGSAVQHGGRIAMPAGDVQIEAVGAGPADGVTLVSGSTIDVRGTHRDFDGVNVFAAAGNVSLAARNGSVVAQPGSRVDVSGDPAGGDAGAIAVLASRGSAVLGGTWLAGAATEFDGGALTIDAGSVADADGAISALNAAGFDRALEVRQRGPGDLVLGGGMPLMAGRIRLTADQGSIRIARALDASGPAGGDVELLARDDVVVAADVRARATTADGRGGRVLLSSTEGSVRTDSAATVDVTAGQGAGPELVRRGEVTVRVGRNAANALLDADVSNDALSLAGSVVGAGRYWLEGFQRYDGDDGTVDAADVAAAPGNPIYDDLLAFIANAPALETALGLSEHASFKVVPGVEISSSGDLRLAADWNLYNWHFADDTPGILTLRAAGDLVFDRSLSDGFATLPDPDAFDPDATASAFVLGAVPRESWSYRLIGGADLASTDPLAVQATADVLGSTGNVRIAAGTCCLIPDPFSVPDYRMVRTGTGDIAVRAARDFLLGNPASPTPLDVTATLYTAGVAGPGIRLPGDFGGLNSQPYPIDGGDISIAVGGSVRGAVSGQLFTDWLWRVGSQPSGPFNPGSPTAWTVAYQSYMQGVGALGGGDVSVRARGDIENFSVSLPTIGRQVGGASYADNRVEVVGAGDLTLAAGGSIVGGTYLIGNGDAVLTSRQTIGTPARSQVQGFPAMSPVLGSSGGGGFTVEARRDLTIESALNATLIRQGYSQQVFDASSYFATYTPESYLSVASVTGNAVLNNDSRTAERLFTNSTSLAGADAAGFLTYPGSVRIAALEGDVSIFGSMQLFPAPKGNLEIFAGESAVFGRQSSAITLTLSDADTSLLPSIARPARDLELVDALLRSPFDPRQHATVPVHSLAAQQDGVADVVPARIVALGGDVRMDVSPQAGLAGIYLAKPVRVTAGENIDNLTLVTQHTASTDVSALQAANDIVYRSSRDADGLLQQSTSSLVVDGPGRLELIAGRTLDLQTSSGVTSRGNLINPALSETGASISVLTGIAGNEPDYAAFIDRYFRNGSGYDAELLAYAGELVGGLVSGKDAALETFEAAPIGLKHALIESVFLAELRSSGRKAATEGTGDFSRGFLALETLFPGANPAVAAGEVNPYTGDINLYFSRIYTLDGGDVNLLAPGGQVNVGLATPPAAFGITKAPSELGIVAQSTGNVSALVFDDFAVNESRVFAADGGSILVWSTGGDIDAGRGAKTAISAPAPIVRFDVNGNVVVTFPAALTGSGIQSLATSVGRKPGDVDLFAPRGVVNAGDAGIVAGNLTIAATAVLGADNIQVSGVSVGVPTDTGGLGASLTGVSAVASAASSAAEDTVAPARDAEDTATPLADEAMGFLDVFVTGFGDPNAEGECDPADETCEQ